MSFTVLSAADVDLDDASFQVLMSDFDKDPDVTLCDYPKITADIPLPNLTEDFRAPAAGV